MILVCHCVQVVRPLHFLQKIDLHCQSSQNPWQLQKNQMSPRHYQKWQELQKNQKFPCGFQEQEQEQEQGRNGPLAAFLKPGRSRTCRWASSTLIWRNPFRFGPTSILSFSCLVVLEAPLVGFSSYPHFPQTLLLFWECCQQLERRSESVCWWFWW